MQQIQIEPLKNHPEFIDKISRACYEEFHHCAPDLTPCFFEKSVEQKLHIDQLPIFFVAIQGKQLIGCFALREREETIEKDFSPPLKEKCTPWLGSVIVFAEFRGKGYGKLLVKCAKEKARQFGYTELFLFTDLKGFYEKLGFLLYQKITVHGQPFTVFRAKLSKN